MERRENEVGVSEAQGIVATEIPEIPVHSFYLLLKTVKEFFPRYSSM